MSNNDGFRLGGSIASIPVGYPAIATPRRERGNELAEVICFRLRENVLGFQKELAGDEELGACLASFGKQVLIRVTYIGFHNPDLVIIQGETDPDGHRVELLQHQSQVQLLLVAIKIKQGTEARRIGFDTER